MPPPRERRITAASSNGITVSPTIWPCSWPLPATTSTSPGRSRSSPAAIAASRSPISVAPGQAARMAARIAAGSSPRGLSSVTIARSAPAAAACAHQRALAAVAVAAGAEHHDQPSVRVRAQRGEQPGQRVRRVRVVDIGRGAVGQPRGQLQPPAHAAQRRQAGERVVLPQGLGERGGEQRVLGLEPAGQRQRDRRGAPRRHAPPPDPARPGADGRRRGAGWCRPRRRCGGRAGGATRSRAGRPTSPGPCRHWPRPARRPAAARRTGAAWRRDRRPRCRDSRDGRGSGW